MNAVQTGPISVNTWIVPLAGNDVFIVDPAGYSGTNDKSAIQDYLKENSLNPVAVVLTHGHFDHVIGLPSIKETFPEIKIAIHKADANCLGKDSATIQRLVLEPMGAEKLFLPYVSNLPEADFQLEDGDTLDKAFSLEYCTKMCQKNEERGKNAFEAFTRWQLIHTPGHTVGSSCFYNQNEKTLISGDTIFYHSYGRTDLYGGSMDSMLKSLGKIKKAIPMDTMVFPGHDASGFRLSDSF